MKGCRDCKYNELIISELEGNINTLQNKIEEYEKLFRLLRGEKE